jgi:hypothetical protein
VSRLVEWLETSGADNVGGVCLTRPGGDSVMARAIALALGHPFGVGNSYFRIGVSAPRWVDTVPFGCYRRQVFERIGLFDESLIRNQDDEFNARLIRDGGRVLLVPNVVCVYYARDSLGKLWRMYHQYGYFKPFVARKLGRIGTARQAVPALFVLAVAGAMLGSPWSSMARWGLGALLLTYGGVVAACGVASGLRYGIRCAAALAVAFPVLHLSYGLGFLTGFFQAFVLRRAPIGAEAAPILR